MEKHELNDKILDEILKYAAASHVEEVDTQWPSDEELSARHTLSEPFEKKMQQLFAEQKRHEQIAKVKRTSLKIAAAVLLFFTVSFVTVMNVDALRVRVMNFFIERGELSTLFSIGHDNAPSGTYDVSLPTYLPTGFTMASLENVDDFYLAIYKDIADNQILIQRLPIGSTIGVDSEDAYIEHIMVNGQPAEYFEKNNMSSLIYKHDEKIYLLSGPLFKDELVKIAESIE